jgi:fimbrial chaperone protein
LPPHRLMATHPASVKCVRHGSVGALVLLALLVLPAPPVRAAVIEISPVRVTLTPAAPTALVTLTNRGDSSVSFRCSAPVWTQREDGAAELTPSDELSLDPPLFTLGPGESRSVRIGATAPAAAVEKTYRLLVEEQPRLGSAVAPGQIQVLQRYSIPVFVAPR